MHKALYYESLADKGVHCLLCPQACSIAEGKRGICWGRCNLGGELYSEFYAQTTSLANDPIEKKPLYHFYPGRDIISIGANGCNLRCRFCQNWSISQDRASTQCLSPQAAVEVAQRHQSLGIAYTYSEPLIWYEYVLDTARLARAAGLKNVLVTNGFINEKPLRRLLPYIDAMNIDLKSIRDEFYRRYCSGRLEPVLKTIQIAQAACHIELTNLIIPGLNDSQEDLMGLIDWVAALNPGIPLHFSRYFPCYKLEAPPTPLATLDQARRQAQAKLKYVYLGNVADEESNCTFCPHCGQRLIRRRGYRILEQLVRNQQCPACQTPIPVVGS